MSKDNSRTYCVGLPVCVTVHEDGSVTAWVDMSEADDLWDGVPTDEDLTPLYDDATVEADADTIRRAINDQTVPLLTSNATKAGDQLIMTDDGDTGDLIVGHLRIETPIALDTLVALMSRGEVM